MALAQYIAAQAFSNVGLGLVHGMAHPMGSLHDIPHGVANALLLPTIMEFNMPTRIEKYGIIAQHMGVDTTGMTPEEAAQAAVDAVRELSIRVGIPQHLSEIGITEADIPALAAQAITDVCTPGNPRDVTEAEIIELYKKVL
jgi:lactaldehyde reductase